MMYFSPTLTRMEPGWKRYFCDSKSSNLGNPDNLDNPGNPDKDSWHWLIIFTILI